MPRPRLQRAATARRENVTDAAISALTVGEEEEEEQGEEGNSDEGEEDDQAGDS